MFSIVIFFFFKQKTAYEMRISDWSSDVCSSDLLQAPWDPALLADPVQERLKDIIAGKQKKKPKKAARSAKEPEPEVPSNVVSIMDALKKSIAQEQKGGKRRCLRGLAALAAHRHRGLPAFRPGHYPTAAPARKALAPRNLGGARPW